MESAVRHLVAGPIRASKPKGDSLLCHDAKEFSAHADTVRTHMLEKGCQGCRLLNHPRDWSVIGNVTTFTAVSKIIGFTTDYTVLLLLCFRRTPELLCSYMQDTREHL